MNEPIAFDPFTASAIADPYPQYHRLRSADPVHWSDRLRCWLLFRHDDVADFFRDDRRLSSDRVRASKFAATGQSANAAGLRTVASDPPAHTPVRAILNTTLGPRVRALGPWIDERIALLLEQIAAATERVVERADLRGEIDLITEFAHPLPIQVIAELLGVPESDRPRFQESSHAVARGMDRFYSGGTSEGLKEMGAYFTAQLPLRRDTPGRDLLRSLLGADHHGEHLNDLEVVAMCVALVFGGHETTGNLIGNGVLALLRHPQQAERLREESGIIETAIEELLRYDSPAQLISRTARTDFELRGKTIRAGDSIAALLGAANRDPEAFADPDRLDLGRSPNPHLAFGLGTHFCPGAQLSRIEARTAIAALLRRFPGLRPGEALPVWRKTIVLRGLERLPVRLA